MIKLIKNMSISKGLSDLSEKYKVQKYEPSVLAGIIVARTARLYFHA
jgi:hypothetical protein